MRNAKAFFLFVCTGALAAVVLGQPGILNRKAPSPTTWIAQQWTGNDKPYQQIEAEIDARIARGEQPEAIAEGYRLKSDSQRSDPKVQFAWGYAIHQAIMAKHGYTPAGLLDALRQAEPGNIYRYARIRFMLTRELEPNRDHQDLAPMGYRLLRRNPEDKRVHITLIYALASSKASLAEALSEACKWVSQQPRDAGAHAVLAYVYETVDAYSRGRDHASRNQAIHEYQAYLRLAPANDGFRPGAVGLVKALQEEKPW